MITGRAATRARVNRRAAKIDHGNARRAAARGSKLHHLRLLRHPKLFPAKLGVNHTGLAGRRHGSSYPVSSSAIAGRPKRVLGTATVVPRPREENGLPNGRELANIVDRADPRPGSLLDTASQRLQRSINRIQDNGAGRLSGQGAARKRLARTPRSPDRRDGPDRRLGDRCISTCGAARAGGPSTSTPPTPRYCSAFSEPRRLPPWDGRSSWTRPAAPGADGRPRRAGQRGARAERVVPGRTRVGTPAGGPPTVRCSVGGGRGRRLPRRRSGLPPQCGKPSGRVRDRSIRAARDGERARRDGRCAGGRSRRLA